MGGGDVRDTFFIEFRIPDSGFRIRLFSKLLWWIHQQDMFCGGYFEKMGYRSFFQLPVWRESVDFAAEVYKFCDKGPLKSDYRMRDQLRAAATSISSNIAEGFEFKNNKEFVRFLFYAKGSTSEVFTQFCILFRAGIVNKDDYRYFCKKAFTLGNKIGGLIQYLKQVKNP